MRMKYNVSTSQIPMNLHRYFQLNETVNVDERTVYIRVETTVFRLKIEHGWMICGAICDYSLGGYYSYKEIDS